MDLEIHSVDSPFLHLDHVSGTNLDHAFQVPGENCLQISLDTFPSLNATFSILQPRWKCRRIRAIETRFTNISTGRISAAVIPPRGPRVGERDIWGHCGLRGRAVAATKLPDHKSSLARQSSVVR